MKATATKGAVSDKVKWSESMKRRTITFFKVSLESKMRGEKAIILTGGDAASKASTECESTYQFVTGVC